RGDYFKAFEQHQIAYQIRESIGDKLGMSNSLNNLGLVFQSQGKAAEAIEVMLKALALQEELQEKVSMSSTLNNIGGFYRARDNFEKALEYYTRAYRLSEEIGNRNVMHNALNNLGLLYLSRKKYDEALQNFEKSLAIRSEINDKQGISGSYNNIGSLYLDKGEYEKALGFFQQALPIKEEIKHKTGIIESKLRIGMCWTQLRQFDKALPVLQEALDLSLAIGDKIAIRDAYEQLSKFYETKQEYAQALQYQRNFFLFADSLKNEEATRRVAQLDFGYQLNKKSQELEILNRDYEIQKIQAQQNERNLLIAQKQAEADRLFSLAENEKNQRKSDSLEYLAKKAQFEADKLRIEEQKSQAELKTQQALLAQEVKLRNTRAVITYILLASFLIVLSLFAVIYRSRQRQIKAKDLIKKQHKALQFSYVELREASDKLALQQAELIQKNKDITDSIQNAQLIQQAILPSQTQLETLFGAHNFFVLYQPRDIVSGDFYYAELFILDQVYFAVADCTGHGVPGALMSMISYELLNEIILRQRKVQTDVILHYLDIEIQKLFIRTELIGMNGLDIGLVLFDHKNHLIEYSGAQIPLYYVKNDQLLIQKPNKHSIGQTPFIKHKTVFERLQLPMGEVQAIYLATDGFQDQFGGTDGKKIKSSGLIHLLNQHKNLPIMQQKQLYEDFFKTWLQQGKYGQIDDMTLVGIWLQR
ncbi:MAG TPA: hypothetical protein DCM08_01525, partial [Microscillaceae bacterium]|nr:hypothetical protein [Microscillaceae bacterium]